MIIDLTSYAIPSNVLSVELAMYNKSPLNLEKLKSKLVFPNGVIVSTNDTFRKLKNMVLDSFIVASNMNPKYNLNPHQLSMDLYGITDFWYILCLLNDKASAMDFTDMETVKYLNKEGAMALITNMTAVKQKKTYSNNSLILKKI